MSRFIDYTAPSLQGTQPKRPQDLPHGLITPPERVRELVAREKAKFPPAVFTPETEERIRKALAVPGRPGVREIAKRFGVAPNTVMRISRPFASAA